MTHSAPPTGLRLVTLGRVELLGAGAEGESLNCRRRKLALLALLALERRPVARDRLLETFWGGLPEARARHSLSDAISHLRRVLGSGAIVARQGGLALASDAPLVVDALALEEAARDGDWRRVIDLDGGPLLAGVVVEGSQSFDAWVAREGARLAALVARACQAGCDALAERGDWDGVATLATRWTETAPDSPRARRFLVRARAALADREAVAQGTGAPEALRERWARAAAGHRQLIVLAGDAPARLAVAAAIAYEAAAGGATVVTVRAYDSERGVPFRLLAELVRALLDVPGLAGVAPAELAVLARLASESVERSAAVHAAVSPSVPVPDALRAALESVAYEAPLLLRVDDAHLADAASRDALLDAARGLTGPVAVLLSVPDHALVPRPAEDGGDDVLRLSLGQPPGESSAGPRAHRPVWRRAVARPFAALGAAAALLLVVAVAAGTREPTVLAVGAIDDRTGGDPAGTARLLPELLATSLARVSELRVLSRARLLEGMAAAGSPAETPAAVAGAARAVGATELLEGTLFRRDSLLRLELRQVRLTSGVVREATVVEARDAFALAESVAVAVARARGAVGPGVPLREVTSTSLVARRFYDEGVRVFYRGDAARALPMFEAALREDPSFAMAAHFAALVHGGLDQPVVTRALRLAERATDRERLLIRATWLMNLNDPRGAAAAETLAVRYADEPNGMLLFGQALEARGDFASAITWFARAAARDSLGLRAVTGVCHACTALGLIRSAALFAGSFKVAEDATRRLASAYRDDQARARLWLEVALIRARDDRPTEAAAAIDSAFHYDPAIEPTYVRLQILTRTGRFAEAERLLRPQLATEGPGGRLGVLENLARLARLQGRHAEALTLARAARALDDRLGSPFTTSARHEAVALMATAPRAAAALFDSIAARPIVRAEFPGRNARHRAWMLTHAGTALAAAGDTVRLAALADTVRRLGALSGYARDQRLHHYVRALLWEARGDTARALADLLQARYSPTETYFGARLARAQLARGLTREAVSTAEAALRGPLDSQNQYEPRTELHAVLADAYARLGDRARAARHHRMAAVAWARADMP